MVEKYGGGSAWSNIENLKGAHVQWSGSAFTGWLILVALAVTLALFQSIPLHMLGVAFLLLASSTAAVYFVSSFGIEHIAGYHLLFVFVVSLVVGGMVSNIIGAFKKLSYWFCILGCIGTLCAPLAATLVGLFVLSEDFPRSMNAPETWGIDVFISVPILTMPMVTLFRIQASRFISYPSKY